MVSEAAWWLALGAAPQRPAVNASLLSPQVPPSRAFTAWPGRTWPPWKPWCGASDRQSWRSSSPSQGSSPHSEVSVGMSSLHIRKQTYGLSENGIVSAWAWDRSRTRKEQVKTQASGRVGRSPSGVQWLHYRTAPYVPPSGQGALLREAARKSTLFSCQSG